MHSDLKPISVITNVSDHSNVRIPSYLPILPTDDAILQAFVFYPIYIADNSMYCFIAGVSTFLGF